MVSSNSLRVYRKQYPNDSIIKDMAYAERITIKSGETHVVEPYSLENDDVFLDRMKRSKEAGKNLFFTEWETFEYEEDVLF